MNSQLSTSDEKDAASADVVATGRRKTTIKSRLGVRQTTTTATAAAAATRETPRRVETTRDGDDDVKERRGVTVPVATAATCW